jgi:hypothetical protein
MDLAELRYSVIAGLVFVASCVVILAVPLMYSITGVYAIRLFGLVSTLALFGYSLIIHFEGYVYVGKKSDSKALVISARLIMGGLALFFLAVIASVLVSTVGDLSEVQYKEVQYANGFVGLSLALLIIPGLIFAFSVLRRFKRLGPLSIAAAILLPTAIVSMWHPWPAALVAAASTVFLWLMLKSEQ